MKITFFNLLLVKLFIYKVAISVWLFSSLFPYLYTTKKTLSHWTEKLQLAISHTLCDINIAAVDILQYVFVEGNNIRYKGSNYYYTAQSVRHI